MPPTGSAMSAMVKMSKRAKDLWSFELPKGVLRISERDMFSEDTRSQYSFDYGWYRARTMTTQHSGKLEVWIAAAYEERERGSETREPRKKGVKIQGYLLDVKGTKADKLLNLLHYQSMLELDILDTINNTEKDITIGWQLFLRIFRGLYIDPDLKRKLSEKIHSDGVVVSTALG